MASSVTGILGTAADGESFSGQAHRLGMASHATIVGDSASALKSRSGIIPGGGTPLDVTALGTPAMKVTVKAGTCAVQSTDTAGGVHTVTLTTATDLDIATASATNPRIDLVVAKVFADGTSATNCTIEVITGTAAASPSRPSIASPPTNTHYFALGQVRVEANATTIVAAKVTKAAGDGQFPGAPGGLVPVTNSAAAASLPNFTPFITSDGLHWTMLGGAARPDGLQHRYIQGTVTTDASGDFTAALGTYFNGSVDPFPFPNGCFGAILQNQYDGAYNLPVFFSLKSTTASSSVWRAYTWSVSNVVPYVGSAVTIRGIAWGY